MKLTDFDKKNYAPQALKENYKMSFDCSKMSMNDTKNLLKKVRTLATEAKQSKNFYAEQASPSYMKLVFMEQALVSHYNDLASRKTQIVVENEEVDKSQVVLAAQDLVDSVQKMVEEVSDMLVKELPALVDSVQSEIGVNESEQFNTQATEALTSLTGALTQAKTTLQSALNVVTGQGGGFGAEEGGAEMGAGMGAELGADMGAAAGAEAGAEMGAEAGAEELPPEPVEEPEAAPVGGVGRAKR